MNFSMNPGQTETLKIVFQDTLGNSHALRDVPTCVDNSGVATITPVGTQTPSDPDFSWTIEVPAGAVVGSSLDVQVTGVNPDGVLDDEHYAILINALDDTVQVATLS
jgi:hypothetical protein